VPVLLPPQLSKTSLERLVRGLDALLLTGGGDVDPATFGEAPHPTLYEVAPARDALETQVTLIALEKKTPLLAICRGIQVLNVALGGSLHQDVATEPGTQIQHSQKEAREQTTHKVTVTPRSRLGRVLGAEDIEVNSFHHQVVKSLGRGLVPVAWAPDQLIEGVELDDDSQFVLGVQWHPEHLVGNSEPARRLFSALVTAARA
jgi:putative glutamine amidotransferase